MKVHIITRHLSLTQALKKYVKRRLKFALGARFEQVKRVEVTLSDVNGPKGGEDKRCQVLLKMKGQSDVVVDDVQLNMYSAIDRASNRASQAVSKRVSRLRHKAKRIKTAIKDYRQDKRDRYLAEDFEQDSQLLAGY